MTLSGEGLQLGTPRRRLVVCFRGKDRQRQKPCLQPHFRGTRLRSILFGALDFARRVFVTVLAKIGYHSSTKPRERILFRTISDTGTA
jgi:hypothetical protein